MILRRSVLGLAAGAAFWPLARESAAAAPPNLPKYYKDKSRVWGELVTDAKGAKQMLSTGPYIADGQGPALYVWMSQFCPRCEAFFRDYRPTVTGVQFRYYILPWPQDNPDQMAQLMVRRSLDDFREYVAHRLTPGPYASTPTGRTLLKDIRYAQTQFGYMMSEDDIYPSMATPAWFWCDGNRVFCAEGYSANPAFPRVMDGIVASVKSSATS